MPALTCILCNITSRFVKRRNLFISFHGFPFDPHIKQAWKEFCGTETGVVCSEHFSDNCFIGGREERNKRRRLIGWAVPTIRFRVKGNGTNILTAKPSKANNSSYSSDLIHADISAPFDSKEELEISEVDTIALLRSQIREYKTKLQEETKKLHELDVAILERDLTIDELRQKLEAACPNLYLETF